jgi:predicted lysophospholipase L1 biosynthesis ABC-type transport system permease subunit
VSYPNTRPIHGNEKAWGLVLAVISFPLGLIALIGLLADQGWARWFGLVLGVLIAVSAAIGAFWLVAIFLPSEGSSYPFAPWFVFLACLVAVLGLLAARTFLQGLRSTEED